MRISVFGTEKGVPLDWRYRTAVPRLVASIIDGLLLVPFYLLAVFALDYLHAMPDLLAALLFAVGTLAYYPYAIIGHARTGRTLGKWAARIRLVREKEQAPGWWLALRHELPGLLLSLVLVSIATRAILSGVNPHEHYGWDWTARAVNLALILPWIWIGLQWLSQSMRPLASPEISQMAGTVVLRHKAAGLKDRAWIWAVLGVIIATGYVQAWGAWGMYLVREYTIVVGPVVQRTWATHGEHDPPIELEVAAISNRHYDKNDSRLVIEKAVTDTGENLLSLRPMLTSGPFSWQSTSMGYHAGSEQTSQTAYFGQYPKAMTSVDVAGHITVWNHEATRKEVFRRVDLEAGLQFEVRDATMSFVDIQPAADGEEAVITVEFDNVTFRPIAMKFTGSSGHSFTTSLLNDPDGWVPDWEQVGESRYQMAISAPAISGIFDVEFEYLEPENPRTFRFDRKVSVITDTDSLTRWFRWSPSHMLLELRRPTDQDWGQPLPVHQPSRVNLTASTPRFENRWITVGISAQSEVPHTVIATDLVINSIIDNRGHDYLADEPWSSNVHRTISLRCPDMDLLRGRLPEDKGLSFTLLISPAPLPSVREITLNGNLRVAYGSELVTTDHRIPSSATSTIDLDGFSLLFFRWGSPYYDIRVRGNRGLLRKLIFLNNQGESLIETEYPASYFYNIENYLWKDSTRSQTFPAATLRVTRYRESLYRDFPFEITIPLGKAREGPATTVILPATP